VSVLTNAGGRGVTARLPGSGWMRRELSAGTQRLCVCCCRCRQPAHPLDMLAFPASPEQYPAALEILLADPGVDSTLVILPPPPMYTRRTVAKSLIPVIHSAENRWWWRLWAAPDPGSCEHFRAAHIPNTAPRTRRLRTGNLALRGRISEAGGR